MKGSLVPIDANGVRVLRTVCRVHSRFGWTHFVRAGLSQEPRTIVHSNDSQAVHDRAGSEADALLQRCSTGSACSAAARRAEKLAHHLPRGYRGLRAFPLATPWMRDRPCQALGSGDGQSVLPAVMATGWRPGRDPVRRHEKPRGFRIAWLRLLPFRVSRSLGSRCEAGHAARNSAPSKSSAPEALQPSVSALVWHSSFDSGPVWSGLRTRFLHVFHAWDCIDGEWKPFPPSPVISS